MRCSSEDVTALLKKWKGESADIFVSSTGRITFWFVGKLRHVASEAIFEIPGVDSKGFFTSLNLRDAQFEYRDSREEMPGWQPRRADAFVCAINMRLDDGRLVVLGELRQA